MRKFENCENSMQSTERLSTENIKRKWVIEQNGNILGIYYQHHWIQILTRSPNSNPGNETIARAWYGMACQGMMVKKEQFQCTK